MIQTKCMTDFMSACCTISIRLLHFYQIAPLCNPMIVGTKTPVGPNIPLSVPPCQLGALVRTFVRTHSKHTLHAKEDFESIPYLCVFPSPVLAFANVHLTITYSLSQYKKSPPALYVLSYSHAPS